MEYYKNDLLMFLFIIFIVLDENRTSIMNLLILELLLLLRQNTEKLSAFTGEVLPHFPEKLTPSFRRLYIFPFISLKGDFEAYIRRGGVYLHEIMYTEALRRKSFFGIDIDNSTIRLAAAGYYATGDGDETRCYSCGKRHRNWRWWEKPENRGHRPGCRHRHQQDPRNVPFRVSPLPIEDVIPQRQLIIPNDYELHPRLIENLVPQQTRQQRRSEELQRLRQRIDKINRLLQQQTTPDNLSPNSNIHPSFSDIQTRISSFENWPKDHFTKPSDLAAAGFFYIGKGDSVRCFCCGLGLKEWEVQDDPWTEHARWRSSCDFVRTERGEEFIKQAQATQNRNLQQSNSGVNNGNSAQNNDDCNAATESLSVSQEENQSLRDESTCEICLVNPSCIAFLPCGHLVMITCAECAPMLRACPVCTTTIPSVENN